MMRFTVLVLAVAVSVCSAMAAQVPRFPKNMRYEQARESLLAAGWRPDSPMPGTQCERPDMCNDRQPEVAGCEKGGLDRCTAKWRSGETVIQITTWGRSPAMVEGVECTVGCR